MGCNKSSREDIWEKKLFPIQCERVLSCMNNTKMSAELLIHDILRVIKSLHILLNYDLISHGMHGDGEEVTLSISYIYSASCIHSYSISLYLLADLKVIGSSIY